MGPTCVIELNAFPSEQMLDRIDAVLVERSEQIVRTRKGCVWDIWIAGHPIHVAVLDSPPRIELSAGCNSAEDYEQLRSLSRELGYCLGGIASELTK